MAARVIHFGTDDCHRLMVLRAAGYAVHPCASLVQLHKALKITADPDAVCIVEGDGVVPEAAGNLARSHSRAPVILFQSTTWQSEDKPFDLVVPILTPPEIWLREIEALIGKSRSLQAQSKVLIENSRGIRQEAAVVRLKAQSERARSIVEYRRSAGPFYGAPTDADDQSE